MTPSSSEPATWPSTRRPPSTSSREAQVDLAPELAAAVTERTEGWPVGLYLAALIAKESPAHVDTVAGDDRYVADYLYRESLEQLPEATQQFLRRTAVLDQLSGPLCDAVLETSDAYAQLRELEAANLFLVPLDRRREWYRYHALFREFLLGELHRAEPDDHHEAAPPGRRLVRGERIAGAGRRAPVGHHRAGPVRGA